MPPRLDGNRGRANIDACCAGGGPCRRDRLFASLFHPDVFPHFFRVFEECDFDSSNAATNCSPVSDSATSNAITDEGFKKMAECYIARNQIQGKGAVPSSSAFFKFIKDKRAADSESAMGERLMALILPSPLSDVHRQDTEANRVRSPNLVEHVDASEAPPVSKAATADAACWAVMCSASLTMTNPDRADPFFSFCLWLLNHCTIPHQSTGATNLKPNAHKCRAEGILCEFILKPSENVKHMVTLVRFCHLLRFWHLQDSFASKSQCIFELCYCSEKISMFNLCSEKQSARSLQECMKLINLDYLAPEARTPSPLTSRWILLSAGRSVKQWGHCSSYDVKKCEVEKESNICEKWRHLIYSYAVMALLYNEFNGNKQGPIGNYDFREKCKIGPVGSSSEKFVYASKATDKSTPSEASDYLGHNIVALAVCKRGSVLRVSYNHNVLFSSTVDHAEERLIDGLFKDPSAFIEKNHAKIYKEGQRVNIEEHMRHISVYTSLEPCQQCSGKLHIAEVPELVFCQRDWVSYPVNRKTMMYSYSFAAGYTATSSTFIRKIQEVSKHSSLKFRVRSVPGTILRLLQLSGRSSQTIFQSWRACGGGQDHHAIFSLHGLCSNDFSLRK